MWDEEPELDEELLALHVVMSISSEPVYVMTGLPMLQPLGNFTEVSAPVGHEYEWS
jgi:hypothetical protein